MRMSILQMILRIIHCDFEALTGDGSLSMLIKMRNKIYLTCLIFILVLGLAGCSSGEAEKTDNSVSTRNMNLIYEETISPNKEYVKNEEEVVNYTVEIYQDEDNRILVNAKSNSGFFEPLQCEVECDTNITKSDVDIEWTTLMGSNIPTEDDQLSIAYVSVSENGKELSKIKISFVNRGIEIIEDALDKE